LPSIFTWARRGQVSSVVAMFLDLNLPLDDEHSAAGGAARAIDFEHVDRRVAMAQQRTGPAQAKA